MTSRLNEEQLDNIVKDMEENILTFTQIKKKHNITSYQYYKVMKEYNLEPEVFKPGPKGPIGPRNNLFRKLLCGPEDVKESVDLLSTECKTNFVEDSKKGLKIHELMNKYNLTLYQIRELRKRFDLKRR